MSSYNSRLVTSTGRPFINITLVPTGTVGPENLQDPILSFFRFHFNSTFNFTFCVFRTHQREKQYRQPTRFPFSPTETQCCFTHDRSVATAEISKHTLEQSNLDSASMHARVEYTSMPVCTVTTCGMCEQRRVRVQLA